MNEIQHFSQQLIEHVAQVIVGKRLAMKLLFIGLGIYKEAAQISTGQPPR